MRWVIINGIVVTLLASTAGSTQGQPPVVTANNVREYVGQTAAVCGQVSRYFCTTARPTLELIFVPGKSGDKLTVHIDNADRTTFGNRVEDRFLGQIVCTQGEVKRRSVFLAQPGPAGGGGSRVVDGSFFVTVATPDDITVQRQDRFKPPASFASDAMSGCHPGVVLPAVLKSVKPRYTSRTLGEKIQGTVILRVVVERNGQVGDIALLTSVHPELDLEAARATKQWVFKPGSYMGQPVPVIVMVEQTFNLK